MTKVQAKLAYADGSVEIREFAMEGEQLLIPKEEIPFGVEYLYLQHPAFVAKTGDAGYFVIPDISPILDNEHAAQILFRERENMTHVFTANNMPVFAVCDGQNSLLAVADGMGLEYDLVAEVENREYRLYPRYQLEEEPPYEDISVYFFPVAGTDWCALARRYREYQLERGACLPLRERIKTNPVLAKSVQGPEIRVCMSAKVIEKIEDSLREQTPENEPPVVARVTFDRLGQVMEAMKEAGCEHADFCLVGWHVGGQDGRLPDLLPVEPVLGGEEGLRRLLAKAKELGYLVGAHTNPMISMTISERLDRNDWQQDKDGTNYVWGFSSGGDCHVLCDKQSYEHYVLEDMELIKSFGFCGTEFMDQISIFRPRRCYHPDHPLNRRQVVEYRRKMLQAGRATTGCISSEGGFDCCIDSYDWAMYPVIQYQPALPPICDNTIPFWHIVYHGIVTYNAFIKTVNGMFKSPTHQLISLEYGARPLAYLHGRWFEYPDEPNFYCRTDEEMVANAKIMAECYKKYQELLDLQFEYLDEHRILEDGVVYTRYSDGSVIIINYLDTPYVYEEKTVAPKSYLRTRI